jgi:hypothetical protein
MFDSDSPFPQAITSFSLKWCSMFDSDSPFPQAISAFADCCEAAATKAGAMHQLPRRKFSRGWRNTLIAVP